MFELFGYALMRAAGLGWLWGKSSFVSTDARDLFGDGSKFLPIGMFGSFVLLIAALVFPTTMLCVFVYVAVSNVVLRVFQAKQSRIARKGDGMTTQIVDQCPLCGKTDSNWTVELRPGADVWLDTLQDNQRVGYGTGNNDHTLYTHRCLRRTV